MEKAKLTDILDVFKHSLKNSSWTSYFFISLYENYWYNIDSDTIYFTFDETYPKNHLGNPGILSQKLCKYIFDNLFISYDPREFVFFFYKRTVLYGDTRSDVCDIDILVEELNKNKQFVVLPKNEENYNYIKSLSRDYKIKKIVI